jgi:hypothetical protein
MDRLFANRIFARAAVATFAGLMVQGYCSLEARAQAAAPAPAPATDTDPAVGDMGQNDYSSPRTVDRNGDHPPAVINLPRVRISLNQLNRLTLS